MPAPAMPTTMRGDGRGTKARLQKPVGRYFAGKGEEIQDPLESEEEEEEDTEGHGSDAEEAENAPRSAPKIQLKDVDLQRHYEQARILEAQRVELEAADAARGSASEYETDEESEEESEEEEETAPRRVLMKPTFISKSQRNGQVLKSGSTLLNEVDPKSTGAADGVELDEQQKRRLEARRIIEEQIRLEATHKSALEEDDGADIDDTDGIDVQAEQAAWKLRELLRIRRERDLIESREEEREEIEKRRAMPEAERMQEDLDRVAREREEKIAARKEEREEAGAGAGKYHHRGGFYQDDPINKRRATGPIENTQAGAGHRGATRWNGLANQDTSKDSIWNASNNSKRRDGRNNEDDDQSRKRRA